MVRPLIGLIEDVSAASGGITIEAPREDGEAYGRARIAYCAYDVEQGKLIGFPGALPFHPEEILAPLRSD